MSKGCLNKVILIGNLGADPDLRYTPGGQPVCDIRLATNEQWKDKQGEKQERTEWHRIVVWGKPGEIIKQYATKGSKLYIEGRLQTRSWEDKEGVKKYSTEIVANDFMFLGGRQAGTTAGAGAGYHAENAGAAGQGGGYGVPTADANGASGVAASADDDIPF